MWYYEQAGSSVGPVGEAELLAKLSSAELPPNTLVWREGLADWREAHVAFPAFAQEQTSVPPRQPPAPVVATGSTAPKPAGPLNPYQTPTSQPEVYNNQLLQTSTLAVTSLVLGMLSLFLSILCLFGVVSAVPAVICGHLAIKEVNNGQVQGKGLALAGLICGYLGLSICMLQLAALLGMIVYGQMV